MSFRIVIALNPSPDLAFEIAVGFAQISQTDRRIINAVQAREVVNECFAQFPRRFRRRGIPEGGSRRMITPRIRSIR